MMRAKGCSRIRLRLPATALTPPGLSCCLFRKRIDPVHPELHIDLGVKFAVPRLAQHAPPGKRNGLGQSLPECLPMFADLQPFVEDALNSGQDMIRCHLCMIADVGAGGIPGTGGLLDELLENEEMRMELV